MSHFIFVLQHTLSREQEQPLQNITGLGAQGVRKINPCRHHGGLCARNSHTVWVFSDTMIASYTTGAVNNLPQVYEKPSLPPFSHFFLSLSLTTCSLAPQALQKA